MSMLSHWQQCDTTDNYDLFNFHICYKMRLLMTFPLYTFLLPWICKDLIVCGECCENLTYWKKIKNRFVKKHKRTVLSSFQHALVLTSILPSRFSFQLKLLWKAEGMVLWVKSNWHGFIPWTTEGLAPPFTWLKCENTLAALIYKSLSYIIWL